MDWGKLFFSAEGRIRRQDFWVTFVILVGAALLLGWFPPAFMLILYCSIVTRTKRLHDMGRTGWLQVIPWISYTVAMAVTVYFVVGAVFTGVNFDSFNEVVAVSGFVFGGLTVAFLWFTAFLVDLGFLLWIGATEGEPDENRFGPPPVRIDDSYVARA